MAGVTDEEVSDLADDIGDNSKLVKLGINLGIKMSQIDMCCAMNREGGRVTSKGTRALLLKGLEELPQDQERGVLKKALENSGLAGLADKYFRDGETESLISILA